MQNFYFFHQPEHLRSTLMLSQASQRIRNASFEALCLRRGGIEAQDTPQVRLLTTFSGVSPIFDCGIACNSSKSLHLTPIHINMCSYNLLVLPKRILCSKYHFLSPFVFDFPCGVQLVLLNLKHTLENVRTLSSSGANLPWSAHPRTRLYATSDDEDVMLLHA